MRILLEASEVAAAHTLDFESLMVGLAGLVRKIVDYEMYSVLVPDGGGNLRIAHAVGYPDRLVRDLRVPFGEGSRVLRNHPLLRGVELPERLGTFSHLGSLVTKGGLVFLGGGDPYLYAFDKATGELVAEVELPAHSDGSPVTYLHRGVQYIVVSIGGRGEPFELIAWRLPGM